jgi:membrane protease YdiL (CAAX protease family)
VDTHSREPDQLTTEREPVHIGEPERPSGIHAIFSGPDGVRAGWRAAGYAVLFLMLVMVLQGLVAFVYDEPLYIGQQINPTALFIQKALETVSAIATALFMAMFENRRFREYGLPAEGVFGGLFWKGAAWGFGLNSALCLGIAAFGGYSFLGFALSGAGAVKHLVVWGVFFVIVGVSEEFLFRGYLQYTVASGIGFWPAAVVTSGVFTLAHVGNAGESPIGLANVFFIAVFFALTLRRTGNLWFPIGFHAAWNFAESHVFSVPISGLVLPNRLLNTTIQGPDWLSGGSAGPEGSALAVAVIAVSLLVFDRVYPGKRASLPRGQ